MKLNFFLLMVLSLGCTFLFGQNNGSVGINTSTPNPNTALDVVSGDKNKGILIPRLTETQRNAITLDKTKDDGLTIYNTTEDCFNYWSLADDEWKSVCGQLGKAVFTLDCSSTVAVGKYVQTKKLDATNYLKVAINVTKIGNYTIIASTDNGYQFAGSGVFFNLGPQVVQIPGQGTPLAIQTDNLAIKANGTDVTCTPPVSVAVAAPAGTFTMSCGSATVNGVYKVGVALTSSNTVTLPVNVTDLGSYNITSNTVDGISFSASGTFTSTGPQNITLVGTGRPSSTTVKTMTLTSDSQGAVSTSCSVKVVTVIPIKKLYSIGTSKDNYGYNFSGTAASGRLLSTASNFGTTATSVVKSEGFTRIDGGSTPNLTALQNNLVSAPVDIVVIGYDWAPSVDEASVIANYIIKGGVVLLFSENETGLNRIFRDLFNDNNISTAGVNAAGALYRLPVTNDEIMNGPFGDIRGKVWGEDASATIYATGIPASAVEIYSNDADLSQTNPGGTPGRITAFKHKTFNFIWVGDGGFNSNCGPSDTICPFELNASNYPVFTPSYGRGGDALDKDVYNSIFTANAFAWAIKQAEFQGINTK